MHFRFSPRLLFDLFARLRASLFWPIFIVSSHAVQFASKYYPTAGRKQHCPFFFCCYQVNPIVLSAENIRKSRFLPLFFSGRSKQLRSCSSSRRRRQSSAVCVGLSVREAYRLLLLLLLLSWGGNFSRAPNVSRDLLVVHFSVIRSLSTHKFLSLATF